MQSFLINIEYGGLGDHLFYSPVPRLIKAQYGVQSRIYLSSRSYFRNWQTYDLVWSRNPYLDGIVDSAESISRNQVLNSGYGNVMQKILESYGLDVSCEPEPEIYYDIPIHPNAPRLIVDLNYQSYTGLLTSDILQIANSFPEDFVFLNPSKLIAQIFPSKRFYHTQSLYEYASVIKSSESFFCLTSGGATLARALNIRANVFAVYSYPKFFTHKMNNYIHIGSEADVKRKFVTSYLWRENIMRRKLRK